MKQRKCNCLACNGRTIRYSRKKQVELLQWALSVNMSGITPDFIDNALKKFDEYHSKLPARK